MELWNLAASQGILAACLRGYGGTRRLAAWRRAHPRARLRWQSMAPCFAIAVISLPLVEQVALRSIVRSQAGSGLGSMFCTCMECSPASSR